ncbi:MAG: tetratricopeptide repeat protein [Candidatus Gastranaerophilales bacterium]|nr:tetratricopeptide repeat protein [Candidatus Gastranaerophilales bacterium]
MKKKIIVILSLFLFLSSNAQEYSQQDVQRYSAYYSNGMQYFKNQQYSSAINEFRKVLRFSPYDETIQDALANAYLARAQYYKTTTKELKKALNDYKSAYFYSKYWKNTTQSQSMASLSNTSLKEILDLEKKLSISQNPQTRFQNAKILRAQGELAACAYDFQNLKTSEYKEQVYENLGNIYKNLNNLSQAMDYFKTAIDINPKNPKLHFLYGVMLDEAQNYEASMEQYNLALQYGDKSPELLEILENKWTQHIVNDPNNAQNYVNLGAIYQKQGNFEGAKAQYQKAYQLDNNDSTILYNLASLFSQQQNYQNAIEVYDRLLSQKPNNIEVLEYKATALKELMRYDEALVEYDKILAIQPNNQNAKSAKENIILNNFSGEKLQNYLKQKALSSPNNYEDQFNLAFELHKNKKYQEAIQFYKKAQSLNPSKEETYLNLAQIYIEQKDYKNANDICQRGLMILPNNQKISQYLNDSKEYMLGSLYDKATKLYEQNKFSEALAQYLNIDNKTAEVNMAIASCYWQLNDYLNANKYYQAVLAQNPANTDALLNSAWAYYSMNDFNNAKLTANKLLAYDKTNQSAKEILKNIEENEFSSLLQKAIENYENGDFENSINLLNKVLTQKPNEEYANYYKGLCFEELKKPNEAIKQYKLLISKSPEFAPVYYSLAIAQDNMEKYQEAVSNYNTFLTLKSKLHEKDEMTEFSKNRVKELKDYLEQLNASK